MKNKEVEGKEEVEEIKEFTKEDIETGDIFQVAHRPTITLRVIKVVEDYLYEKEEEKVTHVVFSFAMSDREPNVLPIEKFLSYINKGMFLKVTPSKFNRGDAFYSITGRIYIVQYPSDIYHPVIGHRYFVTVVDTIGQEDCEKDKWGVQKGKRYKLEEAILDEEVLESLEPFETYYNLEELEISLDDMEEEYESIKPLEDVTHRKGYVM